MDLLIVLLYNGIKYYIYAIIIYVILGYFPDTRRNKIYQILESICEPFLNVFRFATISGISFSPILAIFTLSLIQQLLIAIATTS